MVIYAVAHYCVSVPLCRQIQTGEGSAGMKMRMEMVPSEEVAEQMSNSAGKETENSACTVKHQNVACCIGTLIFRFTLTVLF